MKSPRNVHFFSQASAIPKFSLSSHSVVIRNLDVKRVFVWEFIIETIKAKFMIIGSASSFNIFNENRIFLSIKVIWKVKDDIDVRGFVPGIRQAKSHLYSQNVSIFSGKQRLTILKVLLTNAGFQDLKQTKWHCLLNLYNQSTVT